MKFAIATSVGLVEPARLIELQRREHLQSLRDLDARLASGVDKVAGELLIEGAVLHLKVDLEWLDLIEHQVHVGNVREEPLMGPLLEARAMTRSYGEGSARMEVLRGVYLRVERGEFVAVMGPSAVASRRCSTRWRARPADVGRGLARRSAGRHHE